MPLLSILYPLEWKFYFQPDNRIQFKIVIFLYSIPIHLKYMVIGFMIVQTLYKS